MLLQKGLLEVRDAGGWRAKGLEVEVHFEVLDLTRGVRHFYFNSAFHTVLLVALRWRND